ncbi:MAG TPA: hypothetical protein VMU90_00520 [Solirubrobacteraceae bacterium]|nr:hypothetical protein [Solirubrobacteraceae bacterium]
MEKTTLERRRFFQQVAEGIRARYPAARLDHLSDAFCRLWMPGGFLMVMARAIGTESPGYSVAFSADGHLAFSADDLTLPVSLAFDRRVKAWRARSLMPEVNPDSFLLKTPDDTARWIATVAAFFSLRAQMELRGTHRGPSDAKPSLDW